MNTTGFFDFLHGSTKYPQKSMVARLNLRHKFIISPFEKEISGARVLDLASHDGRWAYAFAGAGAREVVGIEGRGELVAKFDSYPESDFKKNVCIHVGDLFGFLRHSVDKGERFDIVGILGIFYHIMDHYGLLTLVKNLNPKLVIIDGEFMTNPWPHIAVCLEDTSKELNSTAHFGGQDKAPVGIPSRSALEKMASTLGFSTRWLDWDALPMDQRIGVNEDYFREGAKRRFTCALRPQD